MEWKTFHALPYYRWLVRDYRASRKVQRMSYIAKGFYRDLLDEEWLEGSIPNNVAALAEICGCPVKVMEKTWPEISPCFIAVNGRLVNQKLESLRTEQDALRVKRIQAGRQGGLAKQSVASAKHVPADARQVPYRRGEESIEKPLSRKKRRDREKEETQPPDPRQEPCKAAVADYWKRVNPNRKFIWGAAEGNNLKLLFHDVPDITIEQFEQCLANRAKSQVNHSERPAIWLCKITSYQGGPLDRFKQPLNGTATVDPLAQMTFANMEESQ